MLIYTWENSQYRYIQTLDEFGMIVDVERILLINWLSRYTIKGSASATACLEEWVD